MLISAVQPLTLIDFPGNIACTVFTLGCNFRCHYCYNSEFVLPEKIKNLQASLIKEDTLWNFLHDRSHLLDGVCVTGGEPTIHKDLPQFLEKIKARGFQVKLDTNGSNPEMLRAVVEQGLVNYVAMDIKAHPSSYTDIIAVDGYANKVDQSKRLLEKGDVAYEFRTTRIPSYHSKEKWSQLKDYIGSDSPHRTLEFTSKNGCLNPDWET